MWHHRLVHDLIITDVASPPTPPWPQLFDVVCRSLKRLTLDPEGIDMVIHPLISSKMYERAVLILTAVERVFAPELQQLRDLVAPYCFPDVPLTLFSDPDVLRAAKEGLALPGSKIDGVCFWLNEVSPVVAVSSRFDRIDNCWFVRRHELEHVDRRHGLSAVMLDTELEGDRAGVGDGVAEEERVAKEAAAEFCVPKRMMDALIARKAPFFYEHDVRGFAATMKVHPGLIAGQRRYRTGLDNRFGNHIVNVRSILAPNAIVDGWGNVAPID